MAIQNSFTRIRKLSTLLIWLVCFAYTTVVIISTDIVMTEKHYITLGLLAVAIVVQLFKEPIRYLMMLLLLVIGFLGRCALLPGEYYFTLLGISMSLPYFLLLSYFLIANRRDLPNWVAYAFSDSK